MFDRIISVDWSGGENKTEGEPVSLRVAVWDQSGSDIQRPPKANKSRRKWSREECREWLREQLANESKRTLAAFDFGFSLPWGSEKAMFQVTGWPALVAQMGRVYAQHGTARATAEAINAFPCLSGHGPYRLTKDDRTERRFYLQHGVGYYRLTELATPQAISQWYLGAGPKVGYHSITGMAALDWLMKERSAGRASFTVWPQETLEPVGNVLVESYPSICPRPATWGSAQGEHERDAWKVLQYLVGLNSSGGIARLFAVSELPFGRVKNVDFLTQVQFEGFILGLN
jgi:hypothetical protein